MFTQTWKKYLPVIVILLKRSASGAQTLNMNHTDFERAAGGRKIKYSFSQLQLNNGRINTAVKQLPLAKEFAVLLQEDELTRKLLPGQNFEFSMSNDFLLTIKNNTPVPEAGSETETEESNEITADQTTAETVESA
jgi:hypothetical protein